MFSKEHSIGLCMRAMERSQPTLYYYVGGNKKPIVLERVISGGQTGADWAALLAARKVGLETGGMAAMNYMNSEGRNPILEMYGLVADSKSRTLAESYIRRSMSNVDAADGTIVFKVKQSPGTDKTINYCREKKWEYGSKMAYDSPHKPLLVISEAVRVDSKCTVAWEKDVQRALDFLKEHNIRTLNVAGHREFMLHGEWGRRVQTFLDCVFEECRAMNDGVKL